MKEGSMDTKRSWPRILVIAGGIAMVIGAVDPLEGSLVILAGSGLVSLGTWLGKSPGRIILYWVWVFALILTGVGLMWVISAFGGFGGSTGRSMWWSLILLPYPVGWVMGVTNLAARLIVHLRRNKPHHTK
jgi:purine-cytosine permease-like protein